MLGLLGVWRRLGRSDLATAALVVWGIGIVAVIPAAVASGFVATGLIERILAAEGGTRDALHAQLAYTGLLNRGFATVNGVTWAAAILLFSAAILRTRALARAVGVAGALAGAALLVGFLSGQLRMDVSGFVHVTLLQAIWLIWLGILLCRRGS